MNAYSWLATKSRTNLPSLGPSFCCSPTSRWRLMFSHSNNGTASRLAMLCITQAAAMTCVHLATIVTKNNSKEILTQDQGVTM